jgi:hypothetical protein
MDLPVKEKAMVSVSDSQLSFLKDLEVEVIDFS